MMKEGLRVFTVILLSLILITIKSNSQTVAQQRRNLTAFCKLYGYVQYFHPSDEASFIDWPNFAVYGAKKMLAVKNDTELIDQLNQIYKSIAPTVTVFSARESPPFNINQLIPANKNNFVPIFWQHYGFKLPYWNSIYQSIRINRVSTLTGGQIANKSYALNIPLPSEQLKGKKFIFSFELSTENHDQFLLSLFNLESKEHYQALKATAVNNKTKLYSFTGKFDQQQAPITFGLLLRTVAKISLVNAKLSVENNGTFQKVPLKNNQVSLGTLSDSKGKYIAEIRDTNYLDAPLFKERLKIGDYRRKMLVSNLYADIPLVVYGTKNYTFPRVDSVIFKATKDSLLASWPRDATGEYDISGEKLSIRLASLVISWNILKHSFPYWEDSAETPETIWDKALIKSFQDVTVDDFLETLKLMYAPLNDGHIFIDVNDKSATSKDATIPILFAFAENKIIVKEVRDSALKAQIKPGDVLETIDAVSALQVLQNEVQYYSGSTQWKRNKGIINFLNGKDRSLVKTGFSRASQTYEVDLTRNYKAQSYIPGSDRNNRPRFEWINKDVFYINLNRTTTETLLKELEKAKVIIIDMRGYLSEFTGSFAQHLIDKPRMLKSGFFVPKILYPDFEKMTFNTDSATLIPQLPHIKAKIYMLLDASAQSAAESFAALYKQNHLATIVGEPSSGTNGNINYIYLLGGYRVSYSGMLVKNADGSKHHLNGVLPDVIVKPTIEGIKNGKDEILEKAVELANKN